MNVDPPKGAVMENSILALIELNKEKLDSLQTQFMGLNEIIHPMLHLVTVWIDWDGYGHWHVMVSSPSLSSCNRYIVVLSRFEHCHANAETQSKCTKIAFGSMLYWIHCWFYWYVCPQLILALFEIFFDRSGIVCDWL